MPGVRDTINCSFSACRVGFRKCWQWVQCHKPLIFVLKDQYNVICLGLSGAGKTTLLTHLTEEYKHNIEPTNGFHIKTLPIKNIILSIKEIGGVHRIQKYWSQYFDGKQAILFVVNSADTEENLIHARDILKEVLNDYRLKGKPCLVIGTHIDVHGSKDDQELEKLFHCLMQGRKWSVHRCSSFDRHQILNIIEILIDMMLSNT